MEPPFATFTPPPRMVATSPYLPLYLKDPSLLSQLGALRPGPFDSGPFPCPTSGAEESVGRTLGSLIIVDLQSTSPPLQRDIGSLPSLSSGRAVPYPRADGFSPRSKLAYYNGAFTHPQDFLSRRPTPQGTPPVKPADCCA
ncbi:hypothetical protein AMTR_s00146p00060810, partial [Amborella trichopoda]